MKIGFKKINDGAILPKYAHDSDSGMDVYAPADFEIMPHSFITIGCGLAAEIPDGYEIQVRPRSGLQCKHGVVGGWGTVDSGYRGEIGITLFNHSNVPYCVSTGDRIAQFVVAPVVRVEIEAIDSLSTTDRGDGGFGSTGRSAMEFTAEMIPWIVGVVAVIFVFGYGIGHALGEREGEDRTMEYYEERLRRYRRRERELLKGIQS